MTAEDRIDGLLTEWRAICNSMSRASWRGTEAEALARIDEIKAEIAKLENAQ